MQQCVNDHLPADDRIGNYPALASVRINDGDLPALRSQGFISSEQRHGQTYFKLRFRRAGKQFVRYVGNWEQAVAIQAELSDLQANTKSVRRLEALTKVASRELRLAKRQLRP